MLAMRAASLTAAGITANAATGFMCLDDLLGCQIHTTNNNQTNNPGCHTKHLFLFCINAHNSLFIILFSGTEEQIQERNQENNSHAGTETERFTADKHSAELVNH